MARRSAHNAHKPHYIVKREGEVQAFDARKVYGSVYAACAITGMRERECEDAADAISKKIERMMHGAKVMPSTTITKFVTIELRKRNKDAAFMYETHRDIA